MALSANAGDVGYWSRIKTRTDELLEMRNRTEDPLAKRAALAERLLALPAFPGSAWIADYQATCRALARGNGVYGSADTAERLALPMLAELGWDVSKENAAFVRGGADAGFAAVLYGGPFGSGKVSLALLCAATGTSFDSQRGQSGTPAALSDRNVVERLLGLYNQIGGADDASAKVVWTDGREWIVLSAELLAQRIRILADRCGGAIMDEAAVGEGGHLCRVTIPTDVTPLEWLSSFADLQAALRCDR